MSDFFRKVLFGSEKNKDFTKEDFPATRQEQFFYVIRTRWRKLFVINFWVLLFFLPTLIWHLFCMSYESSFGAISAENVSEYMQYVIAYRSLPAAIGMGVAALGIAGGFHAVRMIVWGEPVEVCRAFFRGIRYSGGPYFGGGLFYGIFSAIWEVAGAMIAGSIISDRTMESLAQGSLAVSKCLLVSVGMFAMALLSNYNMKLLHCIKSSILLVFQTFFKTAAFLFVSLFPTALWFLTGNVYGEVVGLLLLLLGGFAYSMLVWCLYTNSVFDRYINLRSYPDYYRKGLRKREEDHA